MFFSIFKEVYMSLTNLTDSRHFCLCFFILHMTKPEKWAIKGARLIEKHKCEFKGMFQAYT